MNKLYSTVVLLLFLAVVAVMVSATNEAVRFESNGDTQEKKQVDHDSLIGLSEQDLMLALQVTHMSPPKGSMLREYVTYRADDVPTDVFDVIYEVDRSGVLHVVSVVQRKSLKIENLFPIGRDEDS